MSYNMWMIRAGESGYWINDFLEKGIIALGFEKIGDFKKFKNVDDIKKSLQEKYPDRSEQGIGKWANHIHNFVNTFKINDHCISYDPSIRIYHIGKIKGDYEYINNKNEHPNIRKVEWIGKVSRDKLTTKTKNALGAWQTIFSLKDEEINEIISLLESDSVHDEKEDEEETKEELDNLFEDYLGKAHEFIKDKVLSLD